MKQLLIIFLLISSGIVAQQERYNRVRISLQDISLEQLDLLGFAVDHGIHKAGQSFITELSETDCHKLDSLAVHYDVLVHDVEAYFLANNKLITQQEKNTVCSSTSSHTYSVPVQFNLGSMGGYLTYQELLDELDAMHQLYPQLISNRQAIDTFKTAEGRPIYMVKLSDNPTQTESEPRILYTALHHAREPMSLSQLVFYMWYLLENYGKDPEITYLLNERELYFVPCLNPDGYVYNQTTNPQGGGMHRKNRRNIGTSNKGVDLNRNYAYGWGTTGTSMDVNSDIYPGTGPFSEPETQAIRWLAQHVDFEIALNAHTYGMDLLYPIGATVQEVAPHAPYFEALSSLMVSQNGYLAEKSSSLYPASGDSDDYLYKMDVGIGEKDTVFAMTPEIGTSFWPLQSEIIPTSKDMVFFNLTACHAAGSYLSVADKSADHVSLMTGYMPFSVVQLGVDAKPIAMTIEPLEHVAILNPNRVYALGKGQAMMDSVQIEITPVLPNGSLIRYILAVNYGTWISRDTITKQFGSWASVINDKCNTISNWTGSWQTTSETYYSSSQSLTDSPNQNYSSNATVVMTWADEIDLTNATDAQVSFHAKWAIEPNYDFCQFQVSTDQGVTWQGQCGKYTSLGVSGNGGVQPLNEPIYEGAQLNWVLEEIKLSDYLGKKVLIRFVLQSDSGLEKDGFYVDDIRLDVSESALGVLSHYTPSFAIYPNPANQHVVLDGISAAAKNIDVFDVHGRFVLSEVLDPNLEEPRLSVLGLEDGVYYVQLTTIDGVNMRQKLYVQHH
jgi:carboxypeptidase T